MKICSLALLTLLLAAPRTESQGLSSRGFSDMCCSKDMFIKRRISADIIESYWNTSTFCPYKAVMVKTTMGTGCMDPKLKWVQKCLKQKKQNSTNTSM